MPMIRETIVTTVSAAGLVHIAPLGIIADGEGWIIAPFRPSTTLDNLRAVPFAVANYTDDGRGFAGCLAGRRRPARTRGTQRLAHHRRRSAAALPLRRGDARLTRALSGFQPRPGRRD